MTIVWDLDPPDVDEAETAMLSVAAHDVKNGLQTGFERGRDPLADKARIGRSASSDSGHRAGDQ